MVLLVAAVVRAAFSCSWWVARELSALSVGKGNQVCAVFDFVLIFVVASILVSPVVHLLVSSLPCGMHLFESHLYLVLTPLFLATDLPYSLLLVHIYPLPSPPIMVGAAAAASNVSSSLGCVLVLPPSFTSIRAPAAALHHHLRLVYHPYKSAAGPRMA